MQLLIIEFVLALLYCFTRGYKSPDSFEKYNEGTCTVISKDHTVITEFPYSTASTFIDYTMVLVDKFKVGSELDIFGSMHENVDGVGIDLNDKNEFTNTIVMHFNPRFNSGVIVRNSFIDGNWGVEEQKGHFNLNKGKDFHIKIVASVNGFHVWTNEVHFCHYDYRLRPETVNSLRINGLLSLYRIVYKLT